MQAIIGKVYKPIQELLWRERLYSITSFEILSYRALMRTGSYQIDLDGAKTIMPLFMMVSSERRLTASRQNNDCTVILIRKRGIDRVPACDPSNSVNKNLSFSCHRPLRKDMVTEFLCM
jgi:hypothetical protein